MPCYYPMKAYRAPGGGIVFNRSGGFVDLPLTVACGQCSGCRLERSRQWAVRCLHESKMHKHNCFLTLTYDAEHLPANNSLDVTHWQDFAKRLRRKMGPFRFFHCGEYGERSFRPHAHAAIFGLDFSEDRTLWKTTKSGDSLYTSPTLEKLWPQGFHSIGTLTFESAAYVARYIMKKATGQLAETHYDRPGQHYGEIIQLKPEYTTMSRRPGIGATWITKFMSDVYPSDEVIVNGKPARPPKFYDSQLEIVNPDLYRKIKSRRISDGKKHTENNTPDRLAVREAVSTARFREHYREF